MSKRFYFLVPYDKILADPSMDELTAAQKGVLFIIALLAGHHDNTTYTISRRALTRRLGCDRRAADEALAKLQREKWVSTSSAERNGKDVITISINKIEHWFQRPAGEKKGGIKQTNKQTINQTNKQGKEENFLEREEETTPRLDGDLTIIKAALKPEPLEPLIRKWEKEFPLINVVSQLNALQTWTRDKAAARGPGLAKVLGKILYGKNRDAADVNSAAKKDLQRTAKYLAKTRKKLSL